MIDNPASRFLDSARFVVRIGSISPLSRLCLAAALSGLLGCSPRPEPEPVEDSVTSGRIKVVCAPEAFGVVSRAAAAFDSLYPEARVEVERGSSRDAIGALFAARAQVAVITRELETEERAAAVRGGLDLEGFRYARDAVRIVVHPSNPVQNLTLDDLRGILRGRIRSWEAVGGRDAEPVVVVQPPGSEVTRHFLQEVLGEEPITVPALTVGSDSAVAAAVRREPRAMGYVTMAAGVEGLGLVRLAALKGLPYWKPDPEAIHRGEYPMTRYHTMYVRTGESRLAAGFVTYVTNIEGQRMVRDAGLVPTAVPVRFVRRSPLRSSH